MCFFRMNRARRCSKGRDNQLIERNSSCLRKFDSSNDVADIGFEFPGPSDRQTWQSSRRDSAKSTGDRSKLGRPLRPLTQQRKAVPCSPYVLFRVPLALGALITEAGSDLFIVPFRSSAKMKTFKAHGLSVRYLPVSIDHDRAPSAAWPHGLSDSRG